MNENLIKEELKRSPIQTTFLFNNYTINESIGDTGVKRFMVKGIMQRADAKNHNGRIYPLHILKREAEKYAKIFIAEGRAYGELDHPDGSIVSGQTASHTVEKLWWEGKDLWGLVEVLDTPTGQIVQEFINKGKTIGISSRGLGSEIPIDENTIQVSDDFELIGWDFVTNPSTHGAFMRKINESLTPINKKYTIINNKLNSILRGL